MLTGALQEKVEAYLVRGRYERNDTVDRTLMELSTQGLAIRNCEPALRSIDDAEGGRSAPHACDG
ncbi:MAG TPA: hypothetical protein VMZ31_04980 [Phycisphaerae bacterium]|nr:hypothetical protein [Phycisphaerae bacterium]